jgi:hypothetical protein
MGCPAALGSMGASWAAFIHRFAPLMGALFFDAVENWEKKEIQ